MVPSAAPNPNKSFPIKILATSVKMTHNQTKFKTGLYIACVAIETKVDFFFDFGCLTFPGLFLHRINFSSLRVISNDFLKVTKVNTIVIFLSFSQTSQSESSEPSKIIEKPNQRGSSVLFFSGISETNLKLRPLEDPLVHKVGQQPQLTQQFLMSDHTQLLEFLWLNFWHIHKL